MAIGERIKAARKNLGLSQAKLADMLGCSENSVFNWETARITPLPAHMEKLVKILGKQILEDPDEQHD